MITVAWSDYGIVQGEFCISIARSIKQDSQQRNLISDIFALPCSAIALARNVVFRDFLERSTSPWLLMVDGDTVWSVEDIYKLYDIAIKNDIKILSGTYFVRIDCAEGCLHTVPALFTSEYIEGTKHSMFVNIANELDKEIVEVEWAGLGALLIHRDVLEQTKQVGTVDNFPYWCAETLIDGYFSGEDHYFFKNIKKQGHKIYATPQVIVGHIKKQVLNLRSYKEEHGFN
jgi:hypothetical protein